MGRVSRGDVEGRLDRVGNDRGRGMDAALQSVLLMGRDGEGLYGSWVDSRRSAQELRFGCLFNDAA